MTTTYFNKGNVNTKTFNNHYDFINPMYNTKKTNKGYVDNLLDKAYDTFLPWMKKKDNIIYIDFDSKEKTYDYTILDVTPMALNLEWNKAVSKLMEYAYYLDNPTYDYMIGNTPIKIHGNYIQVGSKIIPTFTNSKFFSKCDKETQINLYNIAVTINMIAA